MRRSPPDWLLYALLLLLMGIGLLNLASIESFPSLSWKSYWTKQLLAASIALLTTAVATLTEGRTWHYFSYALYAFWVGMMLLTAIFAREINGARAWLDIGPLRLQSSEFMKVATALAVGNFLTRYSFRWERLWDRVGLALLIGLPVGLTLLQRDTGTALTYAALLVPLYRWGLSGWVVGLPLIFGGLAFATLLFSWVKVGLVVSGVVLLSYLLVRRGIWLHVGILAGIWSWLAISGLLYEKVLAPHQRQRIEALFDPYKDPLGSGWNTIQARIAIVAGGVTGRGLGKGLQSKLDFIPQRHTDFALCSIAEEWGWVGTTVILALFVLFLWRVGWVSEKAGSPAAMLFGYGLAGFLWIHFLINTAMVLGIFPVIGIPLPFISYGGSSWASMAWGIGMLQSFYRERSLRLFG